MTLRCIYAFTLAAAALLTGCASVREVQSTVKSYSTLGALPAPATYRLEVLPSQREAQAHFAAIESQAQQALARVGLQRDDAGASLVVQIGADARHVRDPAAWPYHYGNPWGPRWGWGIGYGGWGHRGWGLSGSFMFDGPPLEHYRAVSIVMRNAATQQIVYETSARRQDVWTDDPAIFGILFDAALTGFPRPPQGTRVVRTTLGPVQQAGGPAAGEPAAGEPAAGGPAAGGPAAGGPAAGAPAPAKAP